MHTSPLEQQISQLQPLLAALQAAESILDKLAILNALPIVQDYLKDPSPIQTFLAGLTPECDYAIKTIIAIGQAPIVFNMCHTEEDRFERLRQLLEQLLKLEIFYQHLGGIIGYHITLLTMIVNQQKPPAPLFDHTRYIYPEGLFIGKDHPEVRQIVRWGIENMGHLAEMYPVGGAGDRLNLIDEVTGTPLPAALLPFLGRTLLEGLIRDLQAREYLAFKLTGKQSVTPIVMMTSADKNNNKHILDICKKHRWFGRLPDSFYFFMQPLVPAITMEGNWSLSSPLTLTLKPCGHGVLWKLAEEQGAFAWLESHGRHQCLIRQINNPIAGLDLSLLALAGKGCHDRKAFGFVSCERLINSAEGTNVLIETQNAEGYEYRLTNIEYTEFFQRGLRESPAQSGGPFSIYPTNTNILFADIPSIRNALKTCLIPGQLINMKSKISYIDPQGHQSYLPGGRLESTMQNIADYLVDQFPHQLSKEECKNNLKTFILYNRRSKTISTTKKSYNPEESVLATPEQAYYDLLSGYYMLLQQCGFELPSWREIEDYLQQGPSCYILLQPALGPLYSVIAQKIRHGHLALGAELQLEIAELDVENLYVDGSLIIEAISPLGTLDRSGFLQYGNESRCTLHHVKIHNKGIDRKATHHYWKNDIHRHEATKIILGEGAEFHAEQVTLTGNQLFEVPAYHRLVLRPLPNEKWVEELTPITQPSWHWQYSFDEDHAVRLQRCPH